MRQAAWLKCVHNGLLTDVVIASRQQTNSQWSPLTALFSWVEPVFGKMPELHMLVGNHLVACCWRRKHEWRMSPMRCHRQLIANQFHVYQEKRPCTKAWCFILNDNVVTRFHWYGHHNANPIDGKAWAGWVRRTYTSPQLQQSSCKSGQVVNVRRVLGQWTSLETTHSRPSNPLELVPSINVFG